MLSPGAAELLKSATPSRATPAGPPGSSSSSPFYFTELNGKVYFRARGPNGYELWTSDGTGPGTVELKDINPGAASSYPTVITRAGSKLWFRATTAKHAVRAGVRGWVRNLADGRVEAVLEGTADAVNEMIDFCSRGPELARVDQIEVVEEDPENLEDFRIR